MSEGIPKNERREEISKKEIIDCLKEDREKGRGLLLKWLEKREKEVDKSEHGAEAKLGLVMELAEIYREAGMIDYAVDAIQAAMLGAEGMGDEDLYWDLRDVLEEYQSFH